jgi:hypothetical protein
MRRSPESVTRLRFGPYSPPQQRKGDRTFCLYRDADVVVTNWTDARIPWPRCRAVESRGGSGLLVTEELKRAVLFESAAALKHWFGVSTKAVWNWRRAFGVSRLGTPGSIALRRELNQELADDLRGRLVSRTRREECRQRAAALDLGRHLIAAHAMRWVGRGWTADQKAILGTRPDAELAKQFRRSETAVRLQRTRLGIPTYQDWRRRG